jgi:type I restriction enzyme R subunit
MMLTGFDSKLLNTLYVDKNLRYHGLLQAFSRTNRILNGQKPIGLIVCFRALKDDVDATLALFAHGSDYSIVVPNLDGFIDKFNKNLNKLFAIARSPCDVDNLKTEEEKAEFVRSFRELLRIKNILTTFAEFNAKTLSGLNISPQIFAEFTGKYRDMAHEVSRDELTGKVSALDDMDFEISLTEQDDINNNYITNLLEQAAKDENEDSRRLALERALAGDPQLFAKRSLIEAFLKTKQPISADNYAIFIDQKRNDDFAKLVAENGLRYKATEEWMNKQNRSGVVPRDIFLIQPDIKNLRSMREDTTNKLLIFMEKYDL